MHTTHNDINSRWYGKKSVLWIHFLLKQTSSLVCLEYDFINFVQNYFSRKKNKSCKENHQLGNICTMRKVTFFFKVTLCFRIFICMQFCFSQETQKTFRTLFALYHPNLRQKSFKNQANLNNTEFTEWPSSSCLTNL